MLKPETYAGIDIVKGVEDIYKGDLSDTDLDIEFFRARIGMHRKNRKLVVECREIIETLIESKERIQCKIKFYQNIGLKLKSISNEEQN